MKRELQRRGVAMGGVTRFMLIAIASLSFMFCGTESFAYQSSKWRYVGSEHFTVSYDQRTKSLASEALSIAEETRDALVGFFGDFVSGKKISIVLSDAGDEPNGWAAEREFLVHVDCRKSQGLLRGDADWLRTVLTHELSHAYSLSMLRSAGILSIGADIASSAENAELSASYVIGDLRVPIWFIEALAQMGSDIVGADSRDPIREMVLRDAALSGRLLSLAEMSRFEGSALEYELAYNQGYSLLKYLQASRPDADIAGLCALTKKKGFSAAMRERYGESVESLYAHWKEDLLARASRGEESRPGTKLFDRDGPYVIETTCAAGGDYVVANWGNDYERLGVFAKGKGGVYARIADYAGKIAKVDRDTGEFWFSKSVYDLANGVETYDLFSVSTGGRPTRKTKGARCLAFDAVGGHLIYARYFNGTTSVVSRKPDGEETVLAKLQYGWSVESISAITRDTALLCVGTPEGPRAAIVADGGLRYPWPDSEAMDVVFAGEDRVVLSSSVEGSPQIYWVDLAEDPATWYRITDAPAGCRFPSVEAGDSGDVLFFAKYEHGGYRLYRLDEPFSDDCPYAVGDDLFAEPEPDDARTYPKSSYVSSDIIADMSTFAFGVDVARSEETRIYPQAVTELSVFTAPENFCADLAVGLAFPANVENSSPPWLSIDADFGLALGPTRESFGYSLSSRGYAKTGYYDWNYSDRSLYADVDFQIAADQVVSLRGSSYANTYDSEGMDAINYFSLNTIGLRWSFGKYITSSFDPADLGGNWTGARIEVARAVSDIKDSRFYSSSYIEGQVPFFSVEASLGYHALLAGDKLGLGISAYGLGTLNATEGSKATPGALSSIGGSGFFSGYPSGYAYAYEIARGAVELSANPFVDGEVRTRAIERASLTLKLEAGYVRYFDGDLGTGVPLSVEARLRHRFYGSPRRQSEAFAAIAVPLNDFMGSLSGAPFQIYAGYSY